MEDYFKSMSYSNDGFQLSQINLTIKYGEYQRRNVTHLMSEKFV